MTGNRRILNIGPINRTTVHHHTQSLLMSVVIFGIGCLFVWGLVEGYILRIASASGAYFTVLFVALLAVVVVAGFMAARNISADYDRLKEIGGDPEQLRKLFSIPFPLTERDADNIKIEKARRSNYLIRFIGSCGRLAIMFGLVGTLIGIGEYALKHLATVEVSAEGFAKVLPVILGGFNLAIHTTIAGIWVAAISLVIANMMLTYSADKYEGRLARALEEGVKRERKEKKE